MITVSLYIEEIGFDVEFWGYPKFVDDSTVGNPIYKAYCEKVNWHEKDYTERQNCHIRRNEDRANDKICEKYADEGEIQDEAPEPDEDDWHDIDDETEPQGIQEKYDAGDEEGFLGCGFDYVPGDPFW